MLVNNLQIILMSESTRDLLLRQSYISYYEKKATASYSDRKLGTFFLFFCFSQSKCSLFIVALEHYSLHWRGAKRIACTLYFDGKNSHHCLSAFWKALIHIEEVKWPHGVFCGELSLMCLTSSSAVGRCIYWASGAEII